jgi:uncharacterized membrane protein YsdA (DUF1294 family)/cold shock CspA family protein
VRSPATETDVFFHIGDYRGGRTAPAEGLQVQYEEIHVGGKGPRAMAVVPLQASAGQRAGTAAARGTSPRRERPPRPPYAAAEIRAMLLLFPGYLALLAWGAWSQRLAVPVALAAPLVGVVTFYLYWSDKFAAQRDARRTPEWVLHAASLVGGWPGAWLGQRLLHHKSNKSEFRKAYWATVALHWAALLAWLASATPGR